MWPFARFEIIGDSMEPNFRDGEKILVYTWARIVPGDAVVLVRGGVPMVKRATQKMEDGWVVRGDNLAASTDSCDFGPVKEKEIIGKVCCAY